MMPNNAMKLVLISERASNSKGDENDAEFLELTDAQQTGSRPHTISGTFNVSWVQHLACSEFLALQGLQ